MLNVKLFLKNHDGSDFNKITLKCVARAFDGKNYKKQSGNNLIKLHRKGVNY